MTSTAQKQLNSNILSEAGFCFTFHKMVEEAKKEGRIIKRSQWKLFASDK